MTLEEVLRDLTDALEGDRPRSREVRLQGARQVLARHCIAVLGIAPGSQLSIAAAIRLASEASDRPARRACAVLLVHALAVPGLVPADIGRDVCTLIESSLRDALLRASYPFGASVEDKRRVLQRLHASIGELMQPLEPTFPNWQGLYAG
jgi:hypothetical protein